MPSDTPTACPAREATSADRASDQAGKRRRRLPPLVVDAKRLARLLGVGVRSIRTWDSAGKLPRPIKLGARTVWVLAEIRRWLAAGAPAREIWEALQPGRNGNSRR